jgi:hypothetical protein
MACSMYLPELKDGVMMDILNPFCNVEIIQIAEISGKLKTKIETREFNPTLVLLIVRPYQNLFFQRPEVFH